jgi:primosomal protein N' (replication factor Y)
MNYYEVCPTKIFRAGSDFLTYESEANLKIGTIILVPLGKSTIPAVIFKKVAKPDFATKPISKTLYDTPLPQNLLSSLLWLSGYYATPLPAVLSAALPAGIEKTRKNTLKPAKKAKTAPLMPLSKAQKDTYDDIANNKNQTILLHGITGSGKTNIYLHLTRDVVSQNQSVIVLVPEIALSSQLVAEFEKHFNNIVLLHSKQTDATRHLLFEKILNADQPLVIIGPRSALFAPVKNLGLIIIDEAHEPAYLQQNTPKYSALRLAPKLAKTLLGSATPLISDYFFAKKSSALISLNELAIKSDKTAKISVIDLKSRENFKKSRYFSDALLASIKNSIANNTLSLIFHNRRGSASLTLCEKCGWQALCPDCFLPLVLHSDNLSLLCHTCGRKNRLPTSCPNCQSANILHKGFGTKFLEAELKSLFPSTKVIRFDADTPDSESINNLYNSVKSGEFPIILGTQILAKGFDFPNLTTLGIVQADTNFTLPDYSSEERGFELLTQVIGRANRGHQNSEIFIQTFQPENPIINLALSSDYISAYKHILKKRRVASLPPFSFLLNITVTYKTETACIKNITNLSRDLKAKYKDLVEISRPAPAFHERTPRGYTWQLIIKSKSRSALAGIAKELTQAPHISTTLDPISLL